MNRESRATNGLSRVLHLHWPYVRHLCLNDPMSNALPLTGVSYNSRSHGWLGDAIGGRGVLHRRSNHFLLKVGVAFGDFSGLSCLQATAFSMSLLHVDDLVRQHW